MTIDNWLNQISDELANAMLPTARLDAEIILAHTLAKPRTWLHAHGDQELDQRRQDIADARIELRRERVPVAYIIGHKEFYGRRFHVSPATLIPRPDSEALIELLADWLQQHDATQLVDVGTGSGCLGITAKLEHPTLNVTLLDNDADALKIARKNVETYQLDIKLLKSSLLDSYPLRADIIIANLPYVDTSWKVSDDTKHEPSQALFAKDNGLDLIKQLIDQTTDRLAEDGALILEADPRQHDEIIDYAKSRSLKSIDNKDFGLLLSR